MTWLWLSATIVLAGAELNAELEHQSRHGSAPGAGHATQPQPEQRTLNRGWSTMPQPRRLDLALSHGLCSRTQPTPASDLDPS
jgi:hypothetical protein